ncbi:MAG: PDZ domain-containing protein [Phycisphaerales bacterium]
MCRSWSLAAAGAVALFGSTSHATAQNSDEHTPDAVMLRFPDVSASHIAFVYANDIWIAPKEGGVATPLSSPAGSEIFPKFNHDGTRIAFSGNYDGNGDVYVLDIEGGVPERLTWHPGSDRVVDWAPDGRVMFNSGREVGQGWSQLFLTTAGRALPERLPVPYGAFGQISEDGRWLAYTPYSSIWSTWKRYQGGNAPDIWLFDLETYESKRITTHEGLDDLPMWSGDSVYYLSDAGPSSRANLWSYNTRSGRREQVTHFTDHDVKWPSIGPDSIVFEHAGRLHLLDLDTNEHHPVEIRIPGDRPSIKSSLIDVSSNLMGMRVSPTGKRAVAEVRGDIWTLPAENGSPRNLTRTDGVAERDPAWSPDGRWIAYFSDETGEYELMITQSDGREEPRRLTSDGSAFRYDPIWSPDSKHIAFTDKTGALYLHTVDSGESKHIDTDEWANSIDLDWAPDSSWIAYAKTAPNRNQVIVLYKVDDGQSEQVTSDMFSNGSPRFDRSGDYLWFASNRSFTPVYGDMDWSFIYPNSTVLLAATLRDDIASPFAPESDEEEFETEEEKDESEDEDSDSDEGDNSDETDEADAGDDEEGDADDGGETDEENGDEADEEEEEEEAPLEIDLDGFEERAMMIAIAAGNYGSMAGGESALFYVRYPQAGVDGAGTLYQYKLDDQEETKILDGVSGFMLSADGQKMLVNANGAWAIADAGPGANLEKRVQTNGLLAHISPRAEWRQILTDAWRIQRDYFYDPDMHGVDWPAIGERYIGLVEYAANREDVNYILGEMIGELNSSHAYRWGGPLESASSMSVGMLGCDFELSEGEDEAPAAFKIARIYTGGPWDADARGPLSQPGVDVNEGDYLVAVNGRPLDTTQEPWAAFQGLAGQAVTITVSESPDGATNPRDLIIEPMSDESNLRYRAWIEAKRQYVDEQTDGRVGYIYVPNTGYDGQNDLIRQFMGQQEKDGLVIDERWNGGGQIPDRFIELLNRPVRNYWARRDGRDWRWPPVGHFGPKVMLINGAAGSGGDCFPFYFRQSGLGKLVGMRTWGGLIGISGNPSLIDGGYTSVPTFGFYEVDGTWGIEGYGVEPDIEVIDDPAKMRHGADPQLDRAIEVVLAEVEAQPFRDTPKPVYPDRSGSGVTDDDR